ncbi:hypothetical protein [Deinococcus apachensis]|uniref:hypothetical protein n=1 Tax=Deinococcus apachensis TaxID=309886 RepID=UPI000367A67B|nr:hypothetical protein [Deinococcus apachensis]
MTLTDAEAKVLRALREGAELAMHVRQTRRGPYYTLAGRRLSVVTFKALEGRKLIGRESGGQARTVYTLTQVGEEALTDWEATRSPDRLLLP